MPLIPKNRKEEWLQGLVEHETTMTPKNRPEEWMKEIIDASGSGGGTGGGVLMVNADVETGTFDKTWKEIHDASFAVIKILDDNTLSTFLVVQTNSSPVGYTVKGVGAMGNDVSTVNAVASSENDYPTATMG